MSRQTRVRAGFTLWLGGRFPALRVFHFLSARVITSKFCVFCLLGAAGPFVYTAADMRSSLSCVRNCVTERCSFPLSAFRALGLDSYEYECSVSDTMPRPIHETGLLRGLGAATGNERENTENAVAKTGKMHDYLQSGVPVASFLLLAPILAC